MENKSKLHSSYSSSWFDDERKILLQETLNISCLKYFLKSTYCFNELKSLKKIIITNTGFHGEVLTSNAPFPSETT